MKSGLEFAFGDLLDDIGKWLVIGVLLSGLIEVFLTPLFIETYLGTGFFSMVMMLIISTPLYICATASTPIAAALVLKGLSPGAALVFLLAGPATNVATITVVFNLLGKRSTVIYIVSILISSLALGMAVNEIYRLSGLDLGSWLGNDVEESYSLISILASAILFLLIAKGLISKHLKL